MNGQGTNTKASRMRSKTRVTSGIVVLGMHRSGTSAITRVLNLLGCALPDALVGPSEGNELGHWEAASAVTLNDQVLASAGSRWNDWGPINADWRASPVRVDMVEKASEVLRQHKTLGPLFVLKDPRICRLADLWLEAADIAEIDMRVVLMLRHPAAVAASLERRDLMEPGYSQLLWLRHLLDAEYSSRGRKRVVCEYERLLLNWRDTIDDIRTGLSIALPRNSPAAHAEVEEFLKLGIVQHDPGLNLGLGVLGASSWLRRTYELLRHWSANGENSADYAELDLIRSEFDNAYPAFSRLLMSHDNAGQFASGVRLSKQLEEELAQISAKARELDGQVEEMSRLRMQDEELEGKLSALSASYDIAQARLNALQADVEEERARRTHAEQERDKRATMLQEQQLLNAETVERAKAAEAAVVDRQADLDRLSARIATLEDAVQASAAEIQAEYERRSDAEAAVLDRQAELEKLVSRIASLEDSAQASAAEILAERERRSDAEAAVLDRQAELEKLASRIASLEDSAQASAAEILAERERRNEAEVRLEASLQRASDLTIDKSLLEGRLASADSAALQRQEEVAQLWSQLTVSESAAAAVRVEISAERERRSEAEVRLEASLQRASDLTIDKGQLEGRLALAESTALQRQEELVQLWGRLAVVEGAAATARAEVLAEQERRSEAEAKLAAVSNDLREVTADKSGFEVRTKISEALLTSLRDAHSLVIEELSEARNALTTATVATERERELRLEREEQLAQAETSLRDLRAQLDALEQLSGPPTEELFAEIAQLTCLLEQQEKEVQGAATASAIAEQRIAEQTTELTLLSSLLAQESSRAQGSVAHTEWLREMTLVTETMPKWWVLMPTVWRRKREHRVYSQAGLFDAEQYLENYPDVSAAGMDPIRHYILHGMAEGRQKWC
jgi:hypothetical protein